MHRHDLEVVTTADEATMIDFSGRTAIVVDVLRATTTIATVLERGAAGVYVASTVDDARRLVRSGIGDLLCGEREGFRVPGFDFGNSPLEFEREEISGRTLVLTTTNGTRAVEACRAADVLVGASLRNAGAVSEWVASRHAAAVVGSGGITIVCSGTDGSFSLDDFYAAGVIARRLNGVAAGVDDAAAAAILLAERPLHEVVNRDTCRHVRVLEEKGFGGDVGFCFEMDRSGVIPLYRDGAFVLDRSGPTD